MRPCWELGKFQLAEPWHFMVEREIAGPVPFTVPEGYAWDGASIPRVFWRIVTPFSPKVITAALEHDWLCDQKPSSVDYLTAARHFRSRLHVGRFRRAAMYNAVRYFGPRW